MTNIYDNMLTTRALEQSLLQLGFLRQANPLHFCVGALQVHLLDAPRLRIYSPSGMYYVAVTSLTHLTQQLAAL